MAERTAEGTELTGSVIQHSLQLVVLCVCVCLGGGGSPFTHKKHKDKVNTQNVGRVQISHLPFFFLSQHEWALKMTFNEVIRPAPVVEFARRRTEHDTFKPC